MTIRQRILLWFFLTNVLTVALTATLFLWWGSEATVNERQQIANHLRGLLALHQSGQPISAAISAMPLALPGQLSVVHLRQPAHGQAREADLLRTLADHRPEHLLIDGHAVMAIRGGDLGLIISPHLNAYSLYKHIIALSLVAVVIAALLTRWCARRLTAPITTMCRIIRSMPMADLKTRMPESLCAGHDEIAQLARDVRNMSAAGHSMVLAQQRLLSHISHDLRTPLTRIQMALEICRVHIQDKRYIDNCLNDCREMDRMIESHLVTARIDGGVQLRFTVIKLQSFIGDALEAVRFQLEHSTLVATINCPDIAIKADPGLLRRAFDNLLGNAITYSPSATTITVMVKISESQQVHISIRDQGPGMSEQQLLETGQSFMPNAQGHGMGVAIAARIMRAHGGSLHLRNARSGGLIASLILPATATRTHNRQTTSYAELLAT